MSDVQFHVTRKITKSQEAFIETLPFGMEQHDVENYSEVEYDANFGEHIVIELDTRDFEARLEEYKKPVPEKNDEVLFADEYCLVRAKINSAGRRWYELIIPLQESWDNVWEDEEEVEVEIY